MFFVCEKWVETETDCYIDPSSSSTKAALLPHLGWVAQPWVTEGFAALSLQAGSHFGFLSTTDSNHPEHLVILYLGYLKFHCFIICRVSLSSKDTLYTHTHICTRTCTHTYNTMFVHLCVSYVYISTNRYRYQVLSILFVFISIYPCVYKHIYMYVSVFRYVCVCVCESY